MRAGRIIGWLAAALGCALLLSGCEAIEEQLGQFVNETPEETTLKVEKDGTIVETVIDRLDQSYYSSAELESMITSTVSEYNQANGEGAVTVDELTMEEGQVLLKMTYRSPQDYAGYNNVRFFNGSMLGAEMEGYLFYNQFWQVKKGETEGSPVSNEVPLRAKEQQVLVTDTSHIVEVPGDVLFVSVNGVPAGRKMVAPAKEDVTIAQQPEGLVLPSSAVYVPEEEHTGVKAVDLEKNYLYVIYEF